MTAMLVPVLLAGGGVAYVLSQQDSSPAVPPGPPSIVKPTSGSPIRIAQQQTSGSQMTRIMAALQSGPVVTYVQGQAKQSGWGANVNKNDPELQQKLDYIKQAAEQQWQNASDVAKVKSADILNKELKLEPPLNGHETWEDISAVVGGAAGGAVGTALCGPVCGAAGAYAGAILGTKIEDLISKNADEVKDWLSSKWGWVEGKAGDVWDFFSDIF